MPSTNGRTPPKVSGLYEFTVEEILAEVARRNGPNGAFGWLADLMGQAYRMSKAATCPELRRKHAQIYNALLGELQRLGGRGLMDQRTAALLGHLWRGGKMANWWQSAPRRTTWFRTANPSPLPADHDVYFSVHPTSAIPSRKDPDTGLPKPITAVRTGKAEVAVINCAFAEWDCKDKAFGGDMKAVLAHVECLRIPPSALVCSGGGYHGYWTLTEPVIVTDDNRAELNSLQHRWVSLVGGDDGSKDIARVLRVPGTKNRKYTPARRVEIVWCDPDHLQLYALQQHLATFGPPDVPPAAVTTNDVLPSLPTAQPERQDTTARAQAYGRAALGAELLALASARNGQRNTQLNESAFKLGGLVAGGVLEASDVIGGLLHTARGLGLDESFTEGQVRATIKSGFEAGLKYPRGVPSV